MPNKISESFIRLQTKIPAYRPRDHELYCSILCLFTVLPIKIFVNNQPDTQFFFLYLFIPILYMFRATKCTPSGESIVSIRLLVYVTLRRVVCRLNLHTTWSPA